MEVRKNILYLRKGVRRLTAKPLETTIAKNRREEKVWEIRRRIRTARASLEGNPSIRPPELPPCRLTQGEEESLCREILTDLTAVSKGLRAISKMQARTTRTRTRLEEILGEVKRPVIAAKESLEEAEKIEDPGNFRFGRLAFAEEIEFGFTPPG